MSSLSSSAVLNKKLVFVGVLSFALLVSVSSVYVGPRYGKRLPYDTRVSLRSSSPRTIQSRSQVRFYAGSRYGGKRSYWETSMPESEIPGTSTDFLQQQQRLAEANSPFECVYVPYVGVRCLPARHYENSWNGAAAESEEDSGSPSSSNSILNGDPSAAVVGGSDA